jgi:hypothetical protein
MEQSPFVEQYAEERDSKRSTSDAYALSSDRDKKNRDDATSEDVIPP